MNVGPYGVLQVLADGIKLFAKEDIVTQNSVKPIFKIAPVIAAASAFTAMAAIPFLPEFTIFGHTIQPIVADINVGVLYVLGVMAVGMYAPLLSGLASSNKWSLLGAARTVIQFLSFGCNRSIHHRSFNDGRISIFDRYQQLSSRRNRQLACMVPTGSVHSLFACRLCGDEQNSV